MADLTIMYLYYNQPKAIKFLESKGHQDYDVDILFVDDGSKKPLKLDWAEVLRIDKDVHWNQPQANNLGFSHIDGVVIRMDVDHYFEREDIKWLKLLSKTIQPKQIIHFKRRTNNGWQTHRNIYMARVGDIMDAGGYDLDFCGNYGYDDLELMFRLNKRGFRFIESKIEVKVNHDGGTKGLHRDTAINYELFIQKRK